MSVHIPVQRPVHRAVQNAMHDAFGVRSQLQPVTRAFLALAANDDGEWLPKVEGIGDVVSVSTSERWYPDFERVYRKAEPGEVGCVGGRVVRNLLLHSEDFSPALWLATAGASKVGVVPGVGPNGEDAYEVTMPTWSLLYQTISLQSGNDYRCRLLVRAKSGSASIGARTMAADFFFTGKSINTDWSDLSGLATVTGSNFIIEAQSAFTLQIVRIQLEDVSAQTNQNPGEYVPTTTSSAVRYFDFALGNTVTNNVVSEASGATFATKPRARVVGYDLTNSLTWSRDLTNAAWTEIGTSVAAYDAVGLTGASNTASTLTDDDGAAFEYVRDDVTAPDDSNDNVLRVFFKKDSDETRFVEAYLTMTGGTAQQLGVDLNTKTGATAVRITTGTVSHEVNDAGDWWEVLVQVQNNGTGNTTARAQIYPAIGTTIGVASSAATGSCVIGNVELFLNKTIREVATSSPIFTEGSTATITASQIDADLGNYADTQVCNLEYTPSFASTESLNSHGIWSANTTNHNDGVYQNVSGARFYTWDRTQHIGNLSGSYSAGDTIKVGGVRHAGDLLAAICVDGDWDGDEAGETYDGTLNQFTSIRIGVSADYPFDISDIQLWNDIASFSDGKTLLDGLQA